MASKQGGQDAHTKSLEDCAEFKIWGGNPPNLLSGISQLENKVINLQINLNKLNIVNLTGRILRALECIYSIYVPLISLCRATVDGLQSK